MRRSQLFLLGLVTLLLLGLGLLIRRDSQRTVDLARSNPTSPAEPRAETIHVDDQPEAPASTKPASSTPSVAQQYEDALSTYTVHGMLRLVGTSEPLPNRKVMLNYSMQVSARQREQPPGLRGFPEASAITDSNGVYSMAVRRHALLDAVSIGEPDGGTLQQAEQQIPLQKTLLDLKLRELSDDLELDVWARPAPILSGRVIDADTLAPVIGASLLISDESFWGSGCISGALGRFEFPAATLADRELHGLSIEAQHPDYSAVQLLVPDPAPDGTFTQLTIALPHGIVVKGRVLGPQEEQLPGVKLALRPLLGSSESYLHEISTNVEAISGEDGGFVFPAVQRFDHAWLVVPVQPLDAYVWYGERRILLDATHLEGLRVHVELQTSVQVTATFPDGTTADRAELQLACEEADGSARVPAAGTWLACPTQRPVRILVRGWKRTLASRSPRYVGEAIRTLELDRQNATQVRIPLLIDSLYAPTDTEPGLIVDATPLPSWLVSNLRMTVCGRKTGPLSRTLVEVNGGPVSPWSPEGNQDLRLRPGWSLVKVGAGGHRPRWFEVFVGERDLAPLRIDLDPLE